MLVFFFLSVAAGQLTNDICPGALSVTDGIGQGNNFAVAVHGYSQFYPEVPANDVFYVYTSTCIGRVSISASANVTLAIGVFTGRSCAGLGPCDSSSVEVTTWSYAVGEKIYFVIGNGYTSDDPTAFQFNISCSPASVAPGDICQHAIPYNGPSISIDTTNAAPDYQSRSDCPYSPDIFVVYNATCNGDATAVVSPSTYIGVFFEGSCDQIVDLDWERACGSSGTTTWPVRNGHLYYVIVGGSNMYNVSISCDVRPRPVNDECEGAISVSSPATVVIDTTNASQSVANEVCKTYTDVWYTYNATCTGDLVVTFNYSAYVVAFAGASCGGTVASRCSSGNNDFSFPVSMSQVYTLAVGGYFSNDVLEANFSCVPTVRPTNDQCVNGINVTANSSSVVDFTNVTTDSYVPSRSCDGELRYDVYFRYTTCVGTNVVSVTNVNGSYSLEIAGFIACGLDPLACASGSGSSLRFDTPFAFPVYIGIGAPTGPPSFAQVNFTCEPAPPTTEPPSSSQPSPAPTTSGAPTAQPTAANAANTTAPTPDENATAPSAVSGAATFQLSFAAAVFAFLA